MWKFILNAILFLSTSCFANNVPDAFLNPSFLEQLTPEQLIADLDMDLEAEDVTSVSVEELEDVIQGFRHPKFSESKESKVKIWFVNNTNPKSGNGSYKNPFNTLIAAQNASKKGDIIFVFPGDNTPKGMNQGFVMKKGQRLLGAGVHHRIDFPEKKLFVHAASTTLPRITNTNGSVVVLANSCEVSGFNIVNITNGDGILGGDPSPTNPFTIGIKNTVIQRNVIGTVDTDHSFVQNAAIYLPNCRGKLVIQHNYIYNILSAGEEQSAGKGIHLLNANFPVSSHVIIKKNIVSNIGSTGIVLLHNSPKGKVKAFIENNIVFNIGQTGPIMDVGADRPSAGGILCVDIFKNFCQNSFDSFDLRLSSTGSAHVKAQVVENVLARSGPLGPGFFPGIGAFSSLNSTLCLGLIGNFSEFGYTLNQRDASKFKLEPLRNNLGLPFTTFGTITRVRAGKCNCEKDKTPTLRLGSGGCSCN